METGNAKGKMKNEKFKTLQIAICILQFAVALSGCIGTGYEVQSGRMDLLYGDPNSALAHFQRAAATDPNYLYFSVLPQGIWTYVGRAYYATGKLPEARQAFERAAARSSDDSLSRLYLGLTLCRDGDRPRGLKEIESGMRGIHEWLDYIGQHFAFTYGRFWDPRREIRSEIQADLKMISGKDIDCPKLVASGEWVGKAMEEEIDRARVDERIEFFRDGEGRDGRP